MPVKKSIHSLTGKLIITIGSLMIAVSVVFWFFLLKYQEKELLKTSVKYGQSFVEYVQKSSRFGMLTFQELLVQQTVEAISSAEGVQRIRILDSKGKIAHSSDKSEIGRILDKNDPICMPCHGNGSSEEKRQLWSISRGQDNLRVLNIIKPIYNEPACYSSACHFHPKEQRILGIVESSLSLAVLDKSIEKQGIAITAYLLIFLIILSVALCSVLWKLVSTPVSLLAEGMEMVAGGNLDYHLDIKTKDEIGELAAAFNAMTSDLKRTKTELIEWGNTLEKKVQEKTEAIHQAQAQLIHSEKLASLGRMAAGVAHEINSPLTGIVTFGHLLLKKFPQGSEEAEDIQVIIEQANRCSTIIKGLLGFARATAMEKQPTAINDVLMRSLNIVRNKADFFNIKVVTDLQEPLPNVKADSSQLQQVFLNLFMNAADAIDGKGTITISTKSEQTDSGGYVVLEFSDTGSGISEVDLQKIFEPFFTTKPVGKGTGLGLAVTHGIIQDHGGKISVKSKIGEGTTFTIRLPIVREDL